jgi:hypothetical protein
MLAALFPLAVPAPLVPTSANDGVDSSLTCDDGAAQAPIDVSPLAPKGEKSGLGVPLLLEKVTSYLAHVNTHFHYGAEHKSDGAYDQTETQQEHGPRPGWFCNTSDLTDAQRKPYNFTSCKDVEVGKTYEVHSVFSSGGTRMGDGLGGAFDRIKNPYIGVKAQVWHSNTAAWQRLRAHLHIACYARPARCG